MDLLSGYLLRKCWINILYLKQKVNIIMFSLRAKSLRTPSNLFVVNLAILDFLMMIKTPIFIYNSFYHGFELGHLGCQIFGFVGTISGLGASITNSAIAYDRYRYFFYNLFFNYSINLLLFFFNTAQLLVHLMVNYQEDKLLCSYLQYGFILYLGQ